MSALSDGRARPCVHGATISPALVGARSSAQAEAARAERTKAKRLSAWEEMWAELETAERERAMSDDAVRRQATEAERAGQTLPMRLATKIADSIQVIISNIHVRLEGPATDNGSAVATGLCMKQLSIRSSDRAEEAAIEAASGVALQKHAELNGLAVYWNAREAQPLAALPLEATVDGMRRLILDTGRTETCLAHFVLAPTTVHANLMVNKRPVTHMEVPKVAAKLSTQALHLSLDAHQFVSIRVLADSLVSGHARRRYLHFRPSSGLGPQQDARVWWVFAIRCVREDIAVRRRVWSWPHMRQFSDLRRAYVAQYEALVQRAGGFRPKLPSTPELAALEAQLDAAHIICLRSITLRRMAHAQPAARRGTAADRRGWTGWLSSFVPLARLSGHAEPVAVAGSAASDVPSGTHSDHGGRSEDDALDQCGTRVFPRAYVGLSFAADLGDVTIALRDDDDARHPAILQARIHDATGAPAVHVVVTQRPSARSVRVQVRFANVSITDPVREEHDACHRLLFAHPAHRRPKPSGAETAASRAADVPVLSLVLETNPDGPATNMALQAALQPLHVLYSRPAVERILRFFMRPTASLATHDRPASRPRRAPQRKHRRVAGLRPAPRRPWRAALEIDLRALTVFIPDMATDGSEPSRTDAAASRAMAVASVSRIAIASVFDDGPTHAHVSVSDVPAGERALVDPYDRYTAIMDGVTLGLASEQAWSSIVDDWGGLPAPGAMADSLPLLEPVSLAATLGVGTLGRDDGSPEAQVAVHVTAVRLALSTARLLPLVRLIHHLAPAIPAKRAEQAVPVRPVAAPISSSAANVPDSGAPLEPVEPSVKAVPHADDSGAYYDAVDTESTEEFFDASSDAGALILPQPAVRSEFLTATLQLDAVSLSLLGTQLGAGRSDAAADERPLFAAALDAVQATFAAGEHAKLLSLAVGRIDVRDEAPRATGDESPAESVLCSCSDRPAGLTAPQRAAAPSSRALLTVTVTLADADGPYFASQYHETAVQAGLHLRPLSLQIRPSTMVRLLQYVHTDLERLSDGIRAVNAEASSPQAPLTLKTRAGASTTERTGKLHLELSIEALHLLLAPSDGERPVSTLAAYAASAAVTVRGAGDVRLRAEVRGAVVQHLGPSDTGPQTVVQSAGGSLLILEMQQYHDVTRKGPDAVDVAGGVTLSARFGTLVLTRMHRLLDTARSFSEELHSKLRAPAEHHPVARGDADLAVQRKPIRFDLAIVAPKFILMNRSANDPAPVLDLGLIALHNEFAIATTETAPSASTAETVIVDVSRVRIAVVRSNPQLPLEFSEVQSVLPGWSMLARLVRDSHPSVPPSPMDINVQISDADVSVDSEHVLLFITTAASQLGTMLAAPAQPSNEPVRSPAAADEPRAPDPSAVPVLLTASLSQFTLTLLDSARCRTDGSVAPHAGLCRMTAGGLRLRLSLGAGNAKDIELTLSSLSLGDRRADGPADDRFVLLGGLDGTESHPWMQLQPSSRAFLSVRLQRDATNETINAHVHQPRLYVEASFVSALLDFAIARVLQPAHRSPSPAPDTVGGGHARRPVPKLAAGSRSTAAPPTARSLAISAKMQVTVTALSVALLENADLDHGHAVVLRTNVHYVESTAFGQQNHAVRLEDLSVRSGVLVAGGALHGTVLHPCTAILALRREPLPVDGLFELRGMRWTVAYRDLRTVALFADQLRVPASPALAAPPDAAGTTASSAGGAGAAALPASSAAHEVTVAEGDRYDRPQPLDPNAWYVASAEAETGPDVLSSTAASAGGPSAPSTAPADDMPARTLSVVCHLDDLEVRLYDDCVGSLVPLLCLAADLSGEMTTTASEQVSYATAGVVLIWYNGRVDTWEPIVEPCRATSGSADRPSLRPWSVSLSVRTCVAESPQPEPEAAATTTAAASAAQSAQPVGEPADASASPARLEPISRQPVSAAAQARLSEISVQTDDLLNITVSVSLLQRLLSVGDAWQRDYQEARQLAQSGRLVRAESVQRHVYPFAVQNGAGEALSFSVGSPPTQPPGGQTYGADAAVWPYHADAGACVEFDPGSEAQSWAPAPAGAAVTQAVDRVRSTAVVGRVEHRMSFRLANWKPVYDVPIGRVGIFTYDIEPTDVAAATISAVPQRVVCEVLLRDGVKVIWIRSTLLVKNHLASPIDVGFGTDESVTHLATVPTDGAYSVPLLVARAHPLRVRPSGKTDYSWSEEIVWALFSAKPVSSLQRFSRKKQQQQQGQQQGQQQHHGWMPLHCPGPQQPSASSSATMATSTFDISLLCERNAYAMVLPYLPTSPYHTLHLYAPMVVRNALPCAIACVVRDTQRGAELSVTQPLLAGATVAFHDADLGHELTLSISFAGFECKQPARIRGADDESDAKVDTAMICGAADGAAVRLGLRCTMAALSADDAGGSGGRRGGLYQAIEVTIYAHYWLVNRTGVALAFCDRSEDGTRLPVGQPSSEPVLFSFAAPGHRKNALMVRPADSVAATSWSRPFSVDAVGSSVGVGVVGESPNRKLRTEYAFGVSIELTAQRLTKLVTFRAGLLLRNRSDRALCIATGTAGESTSAMRNARLAEPTELLVLSPMDDSPYYWSDGVAHRLVMQHVVAGATHATPWEPASSWSAPLDVDTQGQFAVKLRYQDPATGTAAGSGAGDEAPRVIVVQCEVVVLQGRTTVTFLPDHGIEPFRIQNWTTSTLYFHQADCWESHELPAQRSMAYALDLPSSAPRLSWNLADVRVDAQELDLSKACADHVVELGAGRRVFGIVFPDAGTRVVLFTMDAHLAKRVAANVGLSSGAPDAQLELSQTVPTVAAYNSFSVNLFGIGVSVIDDSLQELLYVGIQDVQIRQDASQRRQVLRMQVQQFQVDNMHDDALYPVAIARTGLLRQQDRAGPGDGEPEQPPIFSMLVRKSLLSGALAHHSSLDMYETISVLLQAMTIRLDDALLLSVYGMAQAVVPSGRPVADWQGDMEASLSRLTASSDPVSASDRFIYVDKLMLHPLDFRITFSLNSSSATASGTPGDEARRLPSSSDAASLNPVRSLLSGIGATLVSIRDAPLRMNAIEITSVFARRDALQQRLLLTYRDNAVYQLLTMLGFTEAFGNPMGMLSSLGTGVRDMFYEPAKAAVEGADVGQSLAHGARSLAHGTVGSALSSLSGAVGSLGKGVATLSMDAEYQRKRSREVRERTVDAGGRRFAKGVWDGITGVVMQPVEGASRKGAKGFFAGIGRGIVGLVAKPVGGVLDLASGTMGHIADLIKSTPMADRLRLPRSVRYDGIVAAYDVHTSVGRYLLKKLDGGAFANDYYVWHVEATCTLTKFLSGSKPKTVPVLVEAQIAWIYFTSERILVLSASQREVRCAAHACRRPPDTAMCTDTVGVAGAEDAHRGARTSE